MTKVLHHRGPDSGDIWLDDKRGIVLGHRRLAIQDLSECGKQPMFSASKRYVIVFNGEIYNFKEISIGLVKRGHQFIGHSDTEVMLAAIEEWGLRKAVQQFVGMFAFALWDTQQQILHLCRDRIGEKPLYYGCLENSLYFASELKAIEKVVSKSALEIDYNGLSGYLRYGYVSAPLSIYQGIYKLPAGSILSLDLSISENEAIYLPKRYSPYADASEHSPQTYWSVLHSANWGLQNIITDEDRVVTELDSLLHRTIFRQMIADVNMGAFLSGGIDSSVVSAIAQHESSSNIKTYTIGFNEKEYDESQYAEAIAKHLGTDHLTMHVTSRDALDIVPDIQNIYDEPFADSSQLPTYLVSKLAREHVTVCLSGDGGDELFAGYNRYHWTQSLWKKLSVLPYPLRLVIGGILAMPAPGMWDSIYQGLTGFNKNTYDKQKLVGLKIQKLAGFMQQKDIIQAYDYLMSYWHESGSLIASHAKDQGYGAQLSLPAVDNFIDQAMYLDQMVYLPGDNLAKVDRASMAVSLETRLPLLSHEVVDLSWRIPTSMKIKNGVSKWALREVLYKYVPQEMIDRPKMGFSVPVARWLRSDLKTWAEDLLNSMDAGGGVLQKDIILKTWQEHLSGKRDHSHRLWTVLMYQSWTQGRR